MKSYKLVLLLAVFLVLFSSLASAQSTPGCCCFGYEPYFDWGIDEATCTSGGGTFYTDITDATECQEFCYASQSFPTCSFNECQSANPDTCYCGDQLTTSTLDWCCAGNIGTKIFNDYTSCTTNTFCTPTTTNQVSGIVNDNSGNLVENALVSVEGTNYYDLTSSTGAYQITNIPAADYITVLAQATGCGDESQTIPFNNNAQNVDFTLVCGGTGNDLCNNYNDGTCCPSNQECSDILSYSVGQTDCPSSWSCFADCPSNNCVPITGPGGCTLGECSFVNNSYCEANGWNQYNIINPNEYDEYCDLCPNDPDCIITPCVPNDCNGDCPAGCSWQEDPDCPLSSGDYFCNTSIHQWCDTWGAVNNNIGWEPLEYCEHCAPLDPGYCIPACPNGIIDYGEECDDNNIYNGDGCDENCTLETTMQECEPNGIWNNWEQCDPQTNFLSNGACDPAIYMDCNDACACVPICGGEFEAPTNIEVQDFWEEPTLKIIWGLPPSGECNEELEDYTVSYCQGDSSLCSGAPFIDLGDTTDLFFIHTPLPNNADYCYKVTANYESTTAVSDMICGNTGDTPCLQSHPDTFCQSDSVSECLQGEWPTYNTISPIEDCSADNGTCVQPPNGDAYCISRGPCEDCNSIHASFGDFVYEHSYSDFKVDYEGNLETCNWLTSYQVCHFDTNEKTVDMLEECADVNSCYNYRSSNNCKSMIDGGNPCGQFTMENEFQCEWNEYMPEEIGNSETDFDLGVCAPTIPENQQCGLCNSSNPIFPVCNVELCDLFGDCYYKKVDVGANNEQIYDCVNAGDLSCKDYNDEADCIGAGGQNFDLDLLNNVNANSSDLFNFKKCKWDSNPQGPKCYRDADDSSEVYPQNSFKDCEDEDLTCLKDFLSPNTTIFPNEENIFGKNFKLPIMIEDNIYEINNPNELSINYCFNYNNTECLNASAFDILEMSGTDDLYIEEFFEEESENEFDVYNVYYYAKDFAKNVEAVKTHEFMLDAKSPRLIDFKYDYTSYLSGTTWLSNLQANFSFNEMVVCNISFVSLEGQVIEPSFVDAPGQNFTWENINIEDNTYFFDIQCVDMHENPDLNDSIQVKIEGDKSINNAMPQGVVFLNNNITLSVETINNATCRFSTETVWYDQMGIDWNPAQHIFEGDFSTEDGLYHDVTIEFANSGYYKFFTACNISFPKQNGLEWIVTENNAADWIFFSIDQVPPQTILVDNEGNPITDFSHYYQQLAINFECYDPNHYVDENGYPWTLSEGLFDGTFGCDSIYMCYDSPNCEPILLGSTTQNYDLPMNGDIANDYLFRYQSKDAAPSNEDNFEELQEQLVLVDSEVPELSITILKNGEPYTGVLSYGTYQVKIVSTKEIGDVISFEYYADYEQGPDSQTWGLTPTIIDLYTYTGNLVIDTNNFYDKSGIIYVSTEVNDYHDVRGEAAESFTFNTQGGPAPIPEPMFSTNVLTTLEKQPGQGFVSDLGEQYPFRYYTGITLADDTPYDTLTVIQGENLYITGYTLMNGEVLFYKINYLGQGGMIPEYRLMQSGANIEEDTKSLKYDVLQGSDFITLDTTVALDNWHNGYLNFEDISVNKGRTSYEEYGEFYEITGSEYLGPGEGQRVSINPPLEKDLEMSADVYLLGYSKSNKWFGQEMTFEYSPATSNLYQVALGLNDSLNIGVSEQFPVYVDSQPLEATGVQPIGGAITKKDMPIQILFTEHASGTGLKESTLEFEITETNEEGTNTYIVSSGQIQLTDFGIIQGYREYIASYVPSGGWENGYYKVVVTAEDYAGNNIDMDSWVENNTIEFLYDDKIPTNPLFTVDGTDENNIDYSYRTVVDDINPGFVLDFTMKYEGIPEELEVLTPEVDVLSPEELTATCSQTSFNLFHCNFGSALTEGLYEFQVRANKILPNGSLGPEGTYLTDFEGKQLKIIVDNTAPSFTLEPEREYIALGQAMTIYINDLNEQFDLWTEIIVESESMELEIHQMDEQYYFIIPEEFDWGEEGDKNIQVTVYDFAGHQTTENTFVVLDSTPPTIEIQNIEAEKGFFYPNTNATVAVRDIIVEGTVDDDTYSLCYSQDEGVPSCIMECQPGQTEQCLQESTDRDEFILNLVVYGENTMETLNTIVLTAMDSSGQETSESLFVLLDLESPGEPEIIFS